MMSFPKREQRDWRTEIHESPNIRPSALRSVELRGTMPAPQERYRNRSDTIERPVSNPPNPAPAVPFLDEASIRRVLRLEDLIPAMERALMDFSAGRVVQPVRSIIAVPQHNGLMGVMPAVYGDIMGSKLVNVFPGNAALGVPTHQAVIAIFRSDTGEPLAMMDGRLITELRTAAVSAVATKLLASPAAKALAILGSGVQARAHVRALALVRKFDEIRVWSRNAQHAQAFAGEVDANATSAEDAVRDADVVVTCTNAPEPVLRGAWLKPGVLINAVGAVGPTRRELDDEAMRGGVLVDSRDAALQESGDVLLAKAEIYAELGELLSGTKPILKVEVTVFKSLGLAVEDLATAKLVLEKLDNR
jgi:thiomorpholine-carboxylate dehydrogenase